MFNGLKTLAVVPARGGSKGIPLKNLSLVDGRSLIAHAGAVIAGLDWLDRAVVSTDHEGIAVAAEDAGIAAPFRRPPDLSGDRIGDIDVLTNALQTMEEIDSCRYDVVLMLQPTSPMRRAEEVTRTMAKLAEDGLDAVWTVSETDSKAHPLKQLVINDDALDYYDPRGSQIIARQQLQPVYHRNGVAYAFTRSCLLDQGTIKGKRTGAVVLERMHISIDTPFDLALAEFVMRRENAA